jgi:hypothetical protein
MIDMEEFTFVNGAPIPPYLATEIVKSATKSMRPSDNLSLQDILIDCIIKVNAERDKANDKDAKEAVVRGAKRTILSLFAIARHAYLSDSNYPDFLVKGGDFVDDILYRPYK